MKILEKNMINLYGQRGKRWLHALPGIIKQLEQQWSLNHIKPVSNMSWNYVALAFQHNNIPVVLKISCDEQSIRDEYKALKHFNGKGAIKVLDVKMEYSALLLEQAVPGDVLKTHHLHKLENTINIYGHVVKALSTCPLPSGDYIHVRNWCDALDRIQGSHIEKHFVDKAKQLRLALIDSAVSEYLCHGDLHLENIIKHGSNWLAIDPKGVIGEMAFEAAACDLISKDEMKDVSTISSKILDRVTKLSKALELNFDRLLSWIFLRVIISAQWFVEDNGDPGQMLALAGYIYPLINQSVFVNDKK